MSEQIGRNCPSKIRTECCHSLLPMPEAAVLAGVKGPRVGPGSALGGQGNQRVWMSGAGVWSRRTAALTGPPPINIDFTNDATGGSASNALFCDLTRLFPNETWRTPDRSQQRMRRHPSHCTLTVRRVVGVQDSETREYRGVDHKFVHL